MDVIEIIQEPTPVIEVVQQPAAVIEVLTGSAGPPGPQGSQGIQGPQGNVGPQGPSGPGALPADTIVAAATRVIANMTTAGDTQPAWRVLGSGQMEWGAGGTTAPDTTIQRAGVGFLLFGSSAQKCSIRIYGGVTSDPVFDARVTTDTSQRWFVRADGQMRWGSGAAATDTFLMRGGVGQLNLGQTDTKAKLRVFGSAAADNILEGYVTTDANARFFVRADGQHQWGDGTAAQDTTFQRAGPGLLYFGNSAQKATLRIHGLVTGDTVLEARVTTDTNPRWQVVASGFTAWGPGGASPVDTNLYRGAADLLKTDDVFDATTMGLATKVKAGAPVDADWTVAPPIGTIVYDTTNSKLWVRHAAGTWKGIVVA